MKTIQKFSISVYVLNFAFKVFDTFCCGNSWRYVWLLTSVCLSALFIGLSFQRTVWVLFFLVVLLEKAWNLISVILLLWCPLSYFSFKFSIVQLGAAAVVWFRVREVLFSVVVRWMLARIVFWVTVYVCWTWTFIKIKLLLTRTAVCTSPLQIFPAAPRSRCMPLVLQSFPRVSKYLI